VLGLQFTSLHCCTHFLTLYQFSVHYVLKYLALNEEKVDLRVKANYSPAPHNHIGGNKVQ